MDDNNITLLDKKMDLNKVLFLSYCMPPLKYPRSIQISRLLKNMPVKPSVIYADEQNNQDLTILPDMDQYVKDKIQIPYEQDNRYINYAKRVLLPLIYNTPDIQKFWSNQLFKAAKDYIKENCPEIVVTFGQPMSVHLAGLKLKKEFPNLKWVAHFSDPWVDNPLNKKGFFTRKYNESLENNVFQKADKLLFTSNETIELILKRYNNPEIMDKLKYLPHAYDENLYNYELNSVKNSNFTISYVGGFYSQRSPKPLFEAILKIKNIDQSLLDNTKFKIVGNLGRHQSLLMQYKEILKYIDFCDNVPYQESLEIMLESDLLLIIDAPAEKSVFFPSKLVDYIGSKKPIIGITPKGTSAEIIKDLGGITADPLDVDSIVQMIMDVLNNKTKYQNFEINKNYLVFESKNITKKFCSILEED